MTRTKAPLEKIRDIIDRFADAEDQYASIVRAVKTLARASEEDFDTAILGQAWMESLRVATRLARRSPTHAYSVLDYVASRRFRILGCFHYAGIDEDKSAASVRKTLSRAIRSLTLLLAEVEKIEQQANV